MSDIMFDKCYRCDAVIVSSATDVAQTITALRAENEKLRAALRDIIADSFSVYAIEVARAALEGKDG